ncbi:MAG: M48 family metalloprotease [Ferruginibacter sp.]|nr:M48 family metalloprotease [Cytophagales bacterium]
MKSKALYCLLGLLLVSLPACDKEGSFNIFGIEDDRKLGLQVSEEIARDPGQYPLLPETGRNGQNELAYGHLRRITGRVLNSGRVQYRNEFVWQTKIIVDDQVKNAFCTPGGYIYVYTGLIKYLDTEDQLAGVLGHEIAHADKRHTTDNLTREYGIQLLLEVALGQQSQGTLVNIARSLTSLRYSRSAEREADESSVTYLCGTEYRADGAAGFFEKLEAEGSAAPPEFLSTHPNPGDRIQAIRSKAQQEGCKLTPAADAQYPDFKNRLP